MSWRSLPGGNSISGCGVVSMSAGKLGHRSCSARPYSMRSPPLAMQGRGLCRPQLPMAGLMHSSGVSPAHVHAYIDSRLK